jgi:hypothetical protein
MDLAVAAFVILPLVVSTLGVWGVHAGARRSGASPAVARRAAVTCAVATATWLIVTWRLAASGTLARWDAWPPPFAIFVVVVLTLGVLLGSGSWGRWLAALPLGALVVVQSFRLPLEVAMHAMAERGVMPPQMSYSGRNVDILTGATALIVALLLRTGIAGRRVVWAWNVFGLATLANIIVVAVASTPPIAAFGPDRLNTWVTEPPFVWLPAVLVVAALVGHLVIFRALRHATAARR